MRDKLIINDETPFELLLEHVKISYQETSPRYKDSFATKYSFPFDFYLDRDLKMKIGDFSSIQKTDLKTIYEDCWHIVDGRINKATLKIISITGNVITAQISTGFEAFPNWNKKLRNLPLDIVKTNDRDMQRRARNVSGHGYPSFNYNFPLIYTNLYDKEELFASFEGALNNTNDSRVFIQNTQNVSNNEYRNKNIILPMPYWLHVLKTGFEDAGYSLHGDVLTDPLLLKSIIAPARKLKLFDRPEPVEWSVGTESYTWGKTLWKKRWGKTKRWNYGWYKSTTQLNFRGKFRIKLKIVFFYLHPSNAPYEYHKPILKLNGRTIYKQNEKTIKRDGFVIDSNPKEDEVIIETTSDTNTLEFSSFDYDSIGVNVLEMEVIPMEIYNQNGGLKNSLADFTEVNLADNLPNQTFGHFVKATKNLLNLDFSIKNGTEVWMNYIQNVFSDTDFVDLTSCEVKNPERIFKEDLSFELAYPKVEKVNEDNYRLFIDKNGDKSKDSDSENKQKIQIPVLPLKMKSYGNNRSASQTTESDDYYQVVLFNGVADNLDRNLALDISPFTVKNIYYRYWQQWLRFRISAINIKWKFLVNKNKFRSVNVFSTIYAYRQKIFIKKINKQSIDAKTYEINLDGDIVRD